MTRQEIAAYIAKSNLPLQARLMANLFMAQMDDRQIRYLGEQAQSVLSHVESKDKPGFEKALIDLGLPEQFVMFLSDKAFNAPHNH